MAAADHVEPRNIEVKKLQRALVKAGSPLGDEARLKALGLN